MYGEAVLLGFPDYRLQAKNLARLLKVEYAEVDIHQFPDGESRIKLPTEIPDRIIICRSLNNPNEKLIELYFIIKAARQKGCEHITLVAPYLCYMRQDKAFSPGEIVSQRLTGRFLGGLVDELITIDPHLHRINSLDEIIKVKRSATLTAAPLISNHISLQISDPLIVGPDEESSQWVKQVAEIHNYDYLIADKTRHDDRQVDIVLPESDIANRNVVLVDDMASTGKTLLNTALQLKELGANNIYCAVTHALFVENAYEELLDAGIKQIWSTDSITHPSNCISLTTLLADNLTSDQ